MTRPGRFLLAALLIVGLGATACSKKPPVAQPPPPPPPSVTPAPPPPPPPPPPPAPPAPAPLTEEQIFANKTVDQLNAEKPFSDAFFDYDKYNIRDDQLGALQKDAEWLKRWSSVKITIEGHCDSRGTSEYNLALGERRANAVKNYLAGLGVAADRMTTISKGKEQPFCAEENESCWAQNRRGHFVVTAK